MAGKYQQPETIKNIISKIGDKEWVLPGIQRKYVWDKERILNLFDSILQGYPIGTLMVWKISDKEVVKKIHFYEFLQDYQERWSEKCKDFNPTKQVFYSVIDGQQRLNSIYIGLNGSYAIKLPRKKWRNAYDSSIQPKTFLYINLCELNKDEDCNRKYQLAFFSDEDFKNLKNTNHWFKMSKILAFNYFDESRLDEDEFIDYIEDFIKKENIEDEFKKEAFRILKNLYKVVFINQNIHYYLEEDNKLDRVVDIFVRTNSGGVPLAFSDLVMSVISSQWSDAGTKIDELVYLIRADTGINISRDFVLKTFLYLFSIDIKFRISNISIDFVNILKNKLDEIGSYIKSACKFAIQIGLSDEVIRAKYAFLPIIYFEYKNNIYIDNLAKSQNEREKCGVFLKLSLIKGLFGGSSDSVLLPIKNIINNFSNEFPIKEISNYFIGKSRNLALTDEEIETRINEASWGTNDSRLLLSIITEINPEYTYNHVDHLYPKSMFAEKELSKLEFLKNNNSLKEFYLDKKNWNTLGNLQLLNSAENESKKDEKLSIWLKRKPEYKSSLFLPKDKDGKEIYGDDQFKEFVEERRKILANLLKEKTKF